MRKISPSLFALIQILNNLEVHSGESLSEKLGISRNAIWKHIQQLVKYQVPLKTARGQGYQLLEPLMLLDQSKIERILSPEKLPISIHYLEIYGSISSTNDQVRAFKKPQMDQIQCCLAEHQTQGRGRFDRAWVSPFGKNMMLSLRLFLGKDMSSLGGISLCMSLAILNALKELGILNIVAQSGGRLGCKWPNDILYFSDPDSPAQKLAGILIEAFAEGHGMTELVVGVGLNINMTREISGESTTQISQAWTSLQEMTGKIQDRSIIVGVLLKHLRQILNRFMEEGFESISQEWSRFDLLLNQSIHLKIGDKVISGIARGVDSSGHLRIEDLTGTGNIKTYSAGEASVVRV
jgi:BirA family biotin operon repressor/biotin-[acetyl-CoA-carboxylase] ligase